MWECHLRIKGNTPGVSWSQHLAISPAVCVYMWVCMRLRGPVCLRANIVMSSAYLCVGDEWPTAYNASSLPPSLSLGVMNSRHVDLKLKKLTEFRPQGGSSPSSSSSSSSLTASSTSPLSPESGSLQVTFTATCSNYLDIEFSKQASLILLLILKDLLWTNS